MYLQCKGFYMITPTQVFELLHEKKYGPPLEEARFIRIAFFDTPDTPRIYNGLAAQISGDDMYGNFILLKTLETTPSAESQHLCENAFTGAAEWEWNGGEDLTGDQLKEAQKLYNQFLLSKINDEVLRLSKELEDTETSWKNGEIDTASYDNICYSIYSKAENLWLDQYGPSRFPEWFEDLKVPENLRDAFNDAFGDFSMTL